MEDYLEKTASGTWRPWGTAPILETAPFHLPQQSRSSTVANFWASLNIWGHFSFLLFGRCCFKHDCCYGQAEKAGCTPKMEKYLWECEDNTAKCDDIEDKCQKMACKCDREAAKCLAKAPYNATHIWWPVARCGTSSPSCEED
ncbi:phospholipase A2-like [Sphaerodactylus townsendi]|uniref:phospholipase A2-like n=1 Tax=Sphaerodactylus townsendi TaxID=933632 RepID=UPI0020274F2B|nr:phospholipase A2-like [Sphaerodactylus townsendi]